MQRSWQHNGSKSTIHDSSGCQVPTGSYPTIAVVFLYVLLLLVVVGAVKGAQSDGCALVLSNTTSQTVVLDLNLHSDVVFSNDCVLRDTVLHFQPPEPPRTAAVTMDGVTMHGGAVLLDAMSDRNLTGITILVRNANVNKASGFFTQTQPSHTVSHIHMHIANSTINVPSDKGAFSIEAHTVHNISITAVDGTNIDSEGMVCSCAATDAATNIQLHAVGDVAVHTTGPAAFSIVRRAYVLTAPTTFVVQNVGLSIRSSSKILVDWQHSDLHPCAAIASICNPLPKNLVAILDNVSLHVSANGPSASVAATTIGHEYAASLVAGVSLVCSSGAKRCIIEIHGHFLAVAEARNRATLFASHQIIKTQHFKSSTIAGLTVITGGMISGVAGVKLFAPVAISLVLDRGATACVGILSGGYFLTLNVASVNVLCDSSDVVVQSGRLTGAGEWSHKLKVSVSEKSVLKARTPPMHSSSVSIASFASKSTSGTSQIVLDCDGDGGTSNVLIASRNASVLIADDTATQSSLVVVATIVSMSTVVGASVSSSGAGRTMLKAVFDNESQLDISTRITHRSAVALASIFCSSGKSSQETLVSISSSTVTINSVTSNHSEVSVTVQESAAIAIGGIASYNGNDGAHVLLNNTNLTLDTQIADGSALTIFGNMAVYNTIPVSGIVAQVAVGAGGSSTITTMANTAIALTCRISRSSTIAVTSHSAVLAASSVASFSMGAKNSNISLSHHHHQLQRPRSLLTRIHPSTRSSTRMIVLWCSEASGHSSGCKGSCPLSIIIITATSKMRYPQSNQSIVAFR